MDTVGIRVSPRQIRESYTFIVSRASRRSPQLDTPVLQISHAEFFTYLTKTLSLLRVYSLYEEALTCFSLMLLYCVYFQLFVLVFA
jgi:hypothetical protein